jgi:hypothetical protein
MLPWLPFLFVVLISVIIFVPFFVLFGVTSFIFVASLFVLVLLILILRTILTFFVVAVLTKFLSSMRLFLMMIMGV